MIKIRMAHRLENAVHWALLGCLAASSLLLVVGLVVALNGQDPRPEGPPLPLPVLLRGAVSGNGNDLMGLGLLALIATPVVRVAVLAAGWALEGNRRFTAVACAVLALLALSFFLGSG